MTHNRCRLYLVTPERSYSESLISLVETALGAGDVASLLVRSIPGVSRQEQMEEVSALMSVAFEHNVALIVDDDPELAGETGADGVHISGGFDAYSKARTLLGSDRIVGADCLGSRHLAMELGEAGADYVAFAGSKSNGQENGGEDRVADPAWWSELFEIPCVIMEPAGLDEASELVSRGADFIRPEDTMWSSAGNAAETVRRYNRLFEKLASDN